MAPETLVGQFVSFIKRKTSQKYRFNLQYESSRWDGLKTLAELGRYSLIVGYARYFSTNGHILDLGCGEGILQEKFSATDYTHYTGVDFSDVAIANANKKGHVNTEYIVGDLNNLTVTGMYDVIIYNESINYLSHPKEAIKRLYHHLNPGGVFIISLVDKHGKEQTGLWEDINSVLVLQERSKVTNLEGNSWTVQVYKIKTD